MKKEHSSFDLTSIQSSDNTGRKWWQFTEMSRKELGQTAVIGFLAGGIIYGSEDLLYRAFGAVGLVLGANLGAVISMIGLAAAILWLYKVIRRK